jgi:hypothetical protein
MSISSCTFTPILPYELWREIFQLATLIPGELEIPVTVIRPDHLMPWNRIEREGPQFLAWEATLPLRVAIQSVSRLWHSFGIELLHRSFHYTDPTKVQLFARTLCIKPSYGVLVKHLTLTLTRGASVDASAISILRSCPQLLTLSATLDKYTSRVVWDPHFLPTSLRQFDLHARYIPLSNLFATLVHFPNLELLALRQVHPEEYALLPARAESFVLPSLRLLRLACVSYPGDVIPTIERIISSLSLPRLTSLSLKLNRESSAPSFCKDLLDGLTYLGLGGPYKVSPVHFFRAINLPRLQILHLHPWRLFEGTLLFEFPNLPIQQIDTLILALPEIPTYGSGGDWCSSLDDILTEARDSNLMPKLKRVILEDKHNILSRWTNIFRVLIRCFIPLADALESRDVECSFRPKGVWEGDMPLRDLIARMRVPLLSSSRSSSNSSALMTYINLDCTF